MGRGYKAVNPVPWLSESLAICPIELFIDNPMLELLR